MLDTPVEYLKGVGPARADALKKELGVFTFRDLLGHYPFRYVDRSRFHSAAEIRSDAAYVQLVGRIKDFQKAGPPRAERLTATLTDSSGSIELVWFKGLRWILNKIRPDVDYIVFGKPAWFNGKYNIPHPEIEPLENRTSGVAGENLQPFYNSTEKLKSRGLDSKGIARILRNLIPAVQGHIPENLPQVLLREMGFITREEALVNVHFPSSPDILNQARNRLKFEELFFIQLDLLNHKMLRTEKSKGHVFEAIGSYFNDFYHHHLPFELTEAQKRVLREIRSDQKSGRQMNRLLQGDVGSGKTLVALMTMLMALDNGYQACLMAPTEILAGQHFATVTRMLGSLDVRVALLTGSTRTPERKKIHLGLQDGTLQILIGTHALIEESVRFTDLGVVIIDEQHRFGVAQRARMWSKNIIPPHILVMTATPIPRTLAMTLYGDLDISVIDELPPGRKPVKTVHFYDKDRLRVFGFIREKIREGRQVYIIYPLIQESEKLDLKDLQDGYESITREFPLPGYAVSMVHGKMASPDKEYEMQRFKKGETQIMVSTTVIEVGVDIPNASVMIIENAERFGLSQLHQLRGRVGRGADQSYCILMSKYELTHEARRRLQTMVRTHDGFEIAEEDLKLRGPGDLQGTQQSGILDLKIADLVKDEKILRLAREKAIRLLETDPRLEQQENKPVVAFLQSMKRHRADWSRIS
ncbi:MAG: ATP-dependent DNA helicase RecG [Bacteroidales bacterium]|nr:ATP-dependent DNA helicase RecG [Bacteroidales bacterium]